MNRSPNSITRFLPLFTDTGNEINHNWVTTWQNQQCGCAASEDSDQPRHPPSLIRVFAVRMQNPWVLSYPLSAERRLWSDWADAQADLSLRWAHTHFVSFVMSRLNYQVPLLHLLNTVLIFWDWWPCIQFTILRRTGTHRRSLTTFMICTVLSWCATPVVW